MTDEELLAIEQGISCVSDADIRELARLARERRPKPTAIATVHMLTKSLRSLRDEAPEGKAFVVVSMEIEDARRIPLYSETTIALREVE